MLRSFGLLAAAALIASTASAATPREMLTTAALQTSDKAQALALVTSAIATTQAQLAANPADREAQIQYAVGIGDRAKLTKSPADAKTARRLFEQFAASNPRNAEAQFAIASWHLDTLSAGFLATTVLGAKRDIGIGALDRAVALAQGKPFITGFAAMFRIRLDPADVATARQLAETAVANPAVTPLDRLAQRSAQQLLVPLRAGNGAAAAALARTMLPFGHISG